MGEATKKICFGSLPDQSCQVWEGSLSKDLGDAEGCTNPNLDLKLGISNIYSSQAEDNHFNNHHPPDSGVRININQTNEDQARKPDFDLNLAAERVDPKRLKVLMRNRIYSSTYRMKKMRCLDQLEKLSITLPTQISNMGQKLEETKNLKYSLLVEKHQLKLQMAAFEKDRILKEVEIRKNMTEVNRLTELYRNQLEAKQLGDGVLPDLNL